MEDTARITGHTPGPWTVLDHVHPGGGIGIGPELDGIGPHAVVTFNGGESEANARLIAAAPTLLKAVKLALLEFDRISYQKRADVGVLTVLHKAIAKAEGRTR